MRRYVDLPEGQLHFREEGTGPQTLVLLHSSPSSSLVFERVLPLFRESLRVIAMDTPGYGQSDPIGDPTVPGYARTVAAGLAALDVSEFSIYGSHTGASIAVEVAATAAPDRVEGLIFSGLPPMDAQDRKARLSGWAPHMVPDDDGEYVEWARQRYFSGNRKRRSLELRHMALSHTLMNLSGYHRGYEAHFGFDPLPALQKVGCKILSLLNPRDLTAPFDRELLSRRPGVQQVEIDCEGDFVWMAPQRFVDAVGDFLQNTSR